MGTTTILKFQLEILPILNRDIQNFRGENLQNNLTKWKNVTSDKVVLDIIENGLKLELIGTPKSNSKFAFLLSHEEKLIVKKKVALFKGKTQLPRQMLLKTIHFYLEYLPGRKRMDPSG